MKKSNKKSVNFEKKSLYFFAFGTVIVCFYTELKSLKLYFVRVYEGRKN